VRRRAVLVVLAAMALAGCGVPTDDTPRALPAERVPFGLLEPDPTGAPTGVPGAATRRSVYLVQENRLVELTKEVPAPGTAVDTLRELLMGPDAEDIEQGLITRIPSGTVVLDVTAPVEGVATINLSGDLSAAGEGLRLAFAQMVYTATAVPGIDRVLFAIDGTPRDVPDDQGETTAEPLGRSDFAQFRPQG
jgi:spore germination protein GerM